MGVVFKRPRLTAPRADMSQTSMKDVNPNVVSSDAPLSLRANSISSSSCELDLCSSADGGSLREWMKSGHDKLHKINNLSLFRKILDMVDSSHSKGKVLQDLRPSFFKVLPSKEVKYCGRLFFQLEAHRSVMLKDTPNEHSLKWSMEKHMLSSYNFSPKQQQVGKVVNCNREKPPFVLGGVKSSISNSANVNAAGPGASLYGMSEDRDLKMKFKTYGSSAGSFLPTTAEELSFSEVDQLEEMWYRSPEGLDGRVCSFSSNIYSLGVLLFELLSHFKSANAHAAAMSDLRHRILPPNFLSEYPKEAGFCLWLLHPEPSLRPTTRDVLQSAVVAGFQEFCDAHDESSSIQDGESETELLLHFLMSVKEQKQTHASKLDEYIRCIEGDIEEVRKRSLLQESPHLSFMHENLVDETERSFHWSADACSNSVFDESNLKRLRNVEDLERVYFSVRSEVQVSGNDPTIRPDSDLLKNRTNLFGVQKDEEKEKSNDHLGAFFDGLCKYARYSKLEVCGVLRNGDFSNTANVICSLGFDRDEDYFAAAGVSKKIKIFDFQALCDDSVDVHYPATELTSKSKISCISWNSYIRNYLASTDYDGVVKIWDASTGQVFEYMEHEKRAWSVDFSRLDPLRFASGSDDFSVKLWSINEKNCLHTIRSDANVCCVQFSSYSSHLLTFGTADYKVYCYDLRNVNAPWCTLSGHERAVSYVKFVDSATIVSASTDNTLKLWDLKKSSSVGVSTNACSLTLRGHTNEKNFVGLSVADGYMACGSETNEVYTYYKSFPKPITSHKFGSIDPITGKETDDDNGQFVSSVCWRRKSNSILAANSSGSIKALQMVPGKRVSL